MMLSFDTLSFARKLSSAGMPPEQAEALAAAQAEIMSESVITKDDLTLHYQQTHQKFTAIETALGQECGALDAKIDSVHSELNAKIDSVHSELNAKIDQKFGELDAKIDSVHSELNAKIDQRCGELDAKIDQKFGELDAKIDSVHGELSARIGQLEVRSDERTVRLESQIILQCQMVQKNILIQLGSLMTVLLGLFFGALTLFL